MALGLDLLTVLRAFKCKMWGFLEGMGREPAVWKPSRFFSNACQKISYKIFTHHEARN